MLTTWTRPPVVVQQSYHRRATSLVVSLSSETRSRRIPSAMWSVPAEDSVLVHQLHVLQRSRRRRVRLTPADRFLWVWLSQIRTEWRSAVVTVRPESVIAQPWKKAPRHTDRKRASINP